ncbi:MAG: hypothetical protein AAF639_13650 [Chloroflexota bacterium]
MLAQTVSVQEGLWIDVETLRRAGLGKQVQIIIQAGAILLTGHTENSRKPLRLEDIDHPLEGTVLNYEDRLNLSRLKIGMCCNDTN